VYRAYPDPPRHAAYLWHELLAGGNDFSWPTRLSRLQSELKAFLSGVPNVSLCALSWPGSILGASDQARLTAHILDCDESSETTVRDLCNGSAVDSSNCRVMFDADADLAAELKEVGGRLQDDRGNPLSGWLLNFASGVCMSVAANSEAGTLKAKVRSSIDRQGHKLVIGRVGRMLWFDPMTRDWHLKEDSKTHLLKVPDGLPSGVIRLSDMLSTTAVALRLLASGLGEKFLGEFGHKNYTHQLKICRKSAQGVAQAARARKITELIQEFRPHLNGAVRDMFTWLDNDAGRGEFVDEIGRDYGDVIAALLVELPELPNTKVVVIGGFGGSHFGRQGDRFLNAVRGQLYAGSRFQGIEVKRAAASGYPFRLLHAPAWGDLFS
jgi:hypothetical protein